MAKANIPALESFTPEQRRALKYVESVVNNIGQQANAEPVGQTPPPPAISALRVTGGAGILHASIQDANPAYRGNTYHMEVIPTGGNWETDAHPIHTGPARAYRGNLGPAIYDARACSGYQTSSPSPWVYAKGIDATGPTAPAFHKSTGSGTGGGAWGNDPYIGNVPPKRA